MMVRVNIKLVAVNCQEHRMTTTVFRWRLKVTTQFVWRRDAGSWFQSILLEEWWQTMTTA